MNLFTVIILCILGIWFVAALRYIIKTSKNGGCMSCSSTNCTEASCHACRKQKECQGCKE